MADGFGDLIRMARERRGMSMARLGDLVGRPRSAVRAWERGEVPEDPSVIAALSAVLDIDEGDLYEAAGIDRPLQAPRPTVEQALATLRSEPAPSPAPVPAGEESRARGAHLRPEEERSDRAPSPSPEVARTGPVAARSFVPVETRVAGRQLPASSGPATSYLEQPEERWRYRLRVLATVLAVGALVVALIWAFGEFRVAVSDVWDALRGAPAG